MDRLRGRTVIVVVLGLCSLFMFLHNGASRDLRLAARLPQEQVLQFETETETTTENTIQPKRLEDGVYKNTISLKGLMFDNDTSVDGIYPKEFSVKLITSVVSINLTGFRSATAATMS